MTDLPREAHHNDATGAFHELGRLVAASSFGSTKASAAAARAPAGLSGVIAERVLRRLRRGPADAVDLQSLLCKLRVGDPTAREQALEVARTAITRYCWAMALLEAVPQDQAQSAAASAIAAVRAWLGEDPAVNVGSFLAYVHESADKAIRQTRERWGDRWFIRSPECVHRDRTPIVFEPRTLRELIGALPDRERTVLVLRAMVGWSVAATAEVISVQPKTVHSLQLKALSRLTGNLARKMEATECQGSTGVDCGVDEVSAELSRLTWMITGHP